MRGKPSPRKTKSVKHEGRGGLRGRLFTWEAPQRKTKNVKDEGRGALRGRFFTWKAPLRKTKSVKHEGRGPYGEGLTVIERAYGEGQKRKTRR